MDGARRRRLADAVLAGYPHGPDAALQATDAALAAADAARVVILVEGISDQMALDALAVRRGRRLREEGVVIVPMGGIHAVGRFLGRFGPSARATRVVGLCDAGEADVVRRALATGGVQAPAADDDLAGSGFFVCHRDLEDELIRANQSAAIERLLDAQGDLAAFRTLQGQPAWRDRPYDAQLHRWIRAGACRNLRYARLLTEAMPLARAPEPLDAVLGAAVE